VNEIAMTHVLEHLGQRTEVYSNILSELYRVCCHGATVTIVVPHPRHDDFLHEATHVRAVTVGLLMFSCKNCEERIVKAQAKSPLAMIVRVNFDVVESEFILDQPWVSKLALKLLTQVQVTEAIKMHNNVVRETNAVLCVIKGNS
jgi:hypothetical protein